MFGKLTDFVFGKPKSPELWRDSNNYRYEYFKRNTGFLGVFYKCSQCWKPMFDKEKIQVDHIIAPSVFAKKKYDFRGNMKSNTSFLARALNTHLNCAAICPRCNQRKKDKFGKFGVYVAKGYFSKVVELIINYTQKYTFMLLALLLQFLYWLLSQVAKLLAKPLTGKSAWYIKLGVIAVYAGVLYYLYKKYFGGAGLE